MFFEEVKRTEGSHDEKNHPRSPPLSLHRFGNENARGDARALEFVVVVLLAFQDRMDHPVVLEVHGEVLVFPAGNRWIADCGLFCDRAAEL